MNDRPDRPTRRTRTDRENLIGPNEESSKIYNTESHKAHLTPHRRYVINTAITKNILVQPLFNWGATIIAADLTRRLLTQSDSTKIIFITTCSYWIEDLKLYLSGLILSEHFEHLSGDMDTNKRSVYWRYMRVIIASPRIVINDMKSGIYFVPNVFHQIFLHDAYKTRDNHTYCQIVNMLKARKYNYKMVAISNKFIKDINSVMKNLSLDCHIDASATNVVQEAPGPSESMPQAHNPSTAIHHIQETKTNPNNNEIKSAHKGPVSLGGMPQVHNPTTTGHDIQETQKNYGIKHAYKAPVPLEYTPQTYNPLPARQHRQQAQPIPNNYGITHVDKVPSPPVHTPRAHTPITMRYHRQEPPQNSRYNEIKHIYKNGSRDMLARRFSSDESTSSSRGVDIRSLISEDEYRRLSMGKYHETELIPKHKEYWAMSIDSFKNVRRPDEKEINLTRWLQSEKSLQKCSYVKPSKDSQCLAELWQYSDTLRSRMPPSNQNTNKHPHKEPTVIVSQNNEKKFRNTERSVSDNQAPITSRLQKNATSSASVTNYTTEFPTSDIRCIKDDLPLSAFLIKWSSRTTAMSISESQQLGSFGLQNNPQTRASVINFTSDSRTSAVCDVQERPMAAVPNGENCTSYQSPRKVNNNKILSLTSPRKRKHIHQDNDKSPAKRNRDIRECFKFDQINNLLNNLSNATKKYCYICKSDINECSNIQKIKTSPVVTYLKDLNIPDIHLIDNMDADIILNYVNQFNKVNGELNCTKKCYICDKNICECDSKETLKKQDPIASVEQPTSSDTNLIDQFDQSSKVDELNDNKFNKNDNFDFNSELDIDEFIAKLNAYAGVTQDAESTKEDKKISESTTEKFIKCEQISSTSPDRPQVEDNIPEQSNNMEQPLNPISPDRPQVENIFPEDSNTIECPQDRIMSSDRPQEDNIPEPSSNLEHPLNPLMCPDRPQVEHNCPEQSNIVERSPPARIISPERQQEDNIPEQFNNMESPLNPLILPVQPQTENNVPENSNIIECPPDQTMSSHRPQEDKFPEPSNILEHPSISLLCPDRPQVEDILPRHPNNLESSISPLTALDVPQVEDNFLELSTIRRFSLSTIKKRK